jgi:hypothetical protein
MDFWIIKFRKQDELMKEEQRNQKSGNTWQHPKWALKTLKNPDFTRKIGAKGEDKYFLLFCTFPVCPVCGKLYSVCLFFEKYFKVSCNKHARRLLLPFAFNTKLFTKRFDHNKSSGFCLSHQAKCYIIRKIL